MFIRHGQGLWFLISLAQNYIKELFEQCDCEADCGSEHVGAGTKHCPRDPGSWVLTQKLSDFPSSIPLWECQINIPSPIYPTHPELDFTLHWPKLIQWIDIGKYDTKTNFLQCNFPMPDYVASEVLLLGELILTTLQQRFPPRDRVPISGVRLRQSLTPALSGVAKQHF